MINYVLKNKISESDLPDFLNEEEIEKVINFHESMKEYKPTDLVNLNNLATRLGIKSIYVKDESTRFGLNAFKGLGGAYALARIICKKLNIDISQGTFEYFSKKDIKNKIKDMIFVTATDGNHGRGVAWAANKLGCKSVVYMPKGSSVIRLNNIKNEGAEAFITDINYDDAVRLAQKKSLENGWYMVQDTAFEGYEEIPNWITQGYATMAYESIEQLKLDGITKPTHIFLQAGVGSFAGSILGYYANVFKNKLPKVIIVEPNLADCIYKSALSKDGEAKFVKGHMNTIMAGLACGEPNTQTWPILRDFSFAYVSCPDYVAARGMRVLASPIKDDRKIISGESGAVGVGLISLLMERESLKSMREDLKLNKDSIVLCFSTEGDTDPIHYNKVVYDGKNPSC